MKHKSLIFLIIAVVILAMIPLPITMYLYNLGFKDRVDNSSNYYDYIKTIYPDFIKEETSFVSNKKQVLHGAFYRYPKTQYKALLVLPHGMGGGHDSYIAEIEYFARAGYLVFSYDNTGTNASEGEKLIGLQQGPIDLDYALSYLKTIPQIASLKTVLYGHSWGGYSVTAVNAFNHNISAIVSVAGFDDPANSLREHGRTIVGEKIEWFMPYVKIYETLLFGKNADLTGVKGLESTDAKVMIIHSADDNVVNFQDNYMAYYNRFNKDTRFTFIDLEDRGHNAVLSKAAATHIEQIEKERKHTENPQAFLEEEQALVLQLDPVVMEKILTFYNENL